MKSKRCFYNVGSITGKRKSAVLLSWKIIAALPVYEAGLGFEHTVSSTLVQAGRSGHDLTCLSISTVKCTFPPNLWLTRLITYKPCVFYIPAAVVCWGFVSFFFLPLPVSIHLHSTFKSIQTGLICEIQQWMNHSEWISAHLVLGNNGESCCFIRRRRTNFQPQYFDLKCTGRRQQDTNWTAMATK